MTSFSLSSRSSCNEYITIIRVWLIVTVTQPDWKWRPSCRDLINIALLITFLKIVLESGYFPSDNEREAHRFPNPVFNSKKNRIEKTNHNQISIATSWLCFWDMIIFAAWEIIMWEKKNIYHIHVKLLWRLFSTKDLANHLKIYMSPRFIRFIRKINTHPGRAYAMFSQVKFTHSKYKTKGKIGKNLAFKMFVNV